MFCSEAGCFVVARIDGRYILSISTGIIVVARTFDIQIRRSSAGLVSVTRCVPDGDVYICQLVAREKPDDDQRTNKSKSETQNSSSIPFVQLSLTHPLQDEPATETGMFAQDLYPLHDDGPIIVPSRRSVDEIGVMRN